MKSTINGITDQEYIKELEGFLHFLAICYQDCKATYFDRHLNTCSVANPNRRDLTDAEESEWTRFPTIQGTKLQHIVESIANTTKSNPIKVNEFIERYKQ